MRAAATVARLMPSPTNRMTLRARPSMAPRAAAWAAPSRNHQLADSPSGWRMSGTSTSGRATAGDAAAGPEDVLAQAATERVRAAASAQRTRDCVGIGRTLVSGEPPIMRAPGSSGIAAPGASSGSRVAPGLHPPVLVRHDPVEGPGIVVEDQRQEVAVAFPHRQLVQLRHGDPLQGALVVALQRRPAVARDQEDEAEP